METKWYSDMWHLLMQPFKRGMDQVVESGTIKKGLFSLAFMTLAPIIPLLLFNALIFPLFPRTEFNGLVPLFVLGILQPYQLLFLWVLHLYSLLQQAVMASIIYNVIVKKMGGIDDVCAVMKVHFYLYAYAAVYYTVGYIILASIFILTFFFTDNHTVVIGILLLGSVILSLGLLWISVELFSRQVKLSKKKTLIAFLLMMAGMILIGVLIAAFLISLSPNKDLIL